MENQQRQPVFIYEDSRNRLRNHIVLETALMERLQHYPEGTDTSDPRYSFSLGAGFAFTELSGQSDSALYSTDVESALDDATRERVTAAFLSTRPYNRYAQEHLFEPEEYAAFVDGYSVVRSAVNLAVEHVTPHGLAH